MSQVCSTVDVNQFAEVGHSLDKCGFYGVSLLKFAGRPGTSPTGSASQVAAWADSEYSLYDGPDIASNGNGMVMRTLFDVLGDASLHFQVIGSTELGFHTDHLTADYIRAWLKLGYPVIISTAESAVYDDDLGGSPYAWDTTNLYHIIVATDFTSDAILCHDTASIAPDGVRSGPRRYDAAKLQTGLTSATAVALPWLVRPVADYDPIAAQEAAAMYPFLSIDEQAAWFVQTVPGQDDTWTCKANGIKLGGAHLKYFRYNGGVAAFGLVRMGEIQLDAAHHPEATAVLYERAVNFFDPNHVYDAPPVDPLQPEKRVYRAHIEPGSKAWELMAPVAPPVASPTVNVTGALAAAQIITSSVTAIEKAAGTLNIALGVQ